MPENEEKDEKLKTEIPKERKSKAGRPKEKTPREKEKNALEDWKPLTKLGNMVKSGEITDIKQVFNSGLTIMEPEIIDAMLPGIEEEVLDISIVQRMHGSGRRVRFRATVAVGNRDGYVGIGSSIAKEVGSAIRKAIREAKLNLIEVRRGCGSWECGCGGAHSIPFKITGKAGSVEVTILPAPTGLGIVTGDVSKKLLRLAGITDVWSSTKGQTQTTLNTVKATFNALIETSMVKIVDKDVKMLGIVEGRVVQ